jgi:colicin import membrane protein
LRAIIECAPYKLPANWFDEWKFFAPVFTERKS